MHVHYVREVAKDHAMIERLCLFIIIKIYCTAKTQYRKSKQIFPEKELRGLSPNFHILMQENMWTDPGNI